MEKKNNIKWYTIQGHLIPWEKGCIDGMWRLSLSVAFTPSKDGKKYLLKIHLPEKGIERHVYVESLEAGKKLAEKKVAEYLAGE